jgi:hypothetical protein
MILAPCGSDPASEKEGGSDDDSTARSEAETQDESIIEENQLPDSLILAEQDKVIGGIMFDMEEGEQSAIVFTCILSGDVRWV